MILHSNDSAHRSVVHAMTRDEYYFNRRSGATVPFFHMFLGFYMNLWWYLTKPVTASSQELSLLFSGIPQEISISGKKEELYMQNQFPFSETHWNYCGRCAKSLLII
ncbi:UNVERIFIED_CONTAM: hypothetical protein NCL1_46943 [Trichonephila clavipes]